MTPLVQPRVGQIPQEMTHDVLPGFSLTSVILSLLVSAKGDTAAAFHNKTAAVEEKRSSK